MEKRKTYTELIKAYAMTQIKNEKFMAEIYADMVLNELVLKKEKEQITKKIDIALDCRDEKSFFVLTNRLRELEKQFGS